MKYASPILMALVILAGLSLIVTPYIAEVFFPAQQTTLRTANPQQVAEALANWMETTPDKLAGTQGVNQTSADGKTSWFMFTVERQPVEHFIRKNRLQQQDLTPQLLREVFTGQNPPAEWWQPASLERETCFIGTDEGRELGLIYDAERQKGFLVIRTRTKTSNF
ncbi:hypothetical protein VSS37_21040 [Candidatus Thiothrix sp. Deng01]|uniref:Uncharacterized protein n=1 Tax=Candidatus Thiothrix phosphatis TaxID=3112415 RepID=A0ABU6D3S9_9GAMM|nr:hypothetical protein [Candidatus Thiothrix sp. Deng01]MEB4593477.1 hypothetical protein [Candidatus Thiothrix sp. Deng01]